MRKFFATVTVIVLILGLTACSADKSNEMSYLQRTASGGSDMAPALMAEPEMALGAMFNSAGSDGMWDFDTEPGENFNIPDMPQATLIPENRIERIIIRNAFMDLESKNPSELYRVLVTYCGFLGGYEFSSDVRNFDDYSIVNAVFKLPPEKLDDFMTYAGDNGKILTSRVDSNDVTNEFHDLSTRLETKRRSLEAYYSLLEKADSIDSIIRLQRTIDGIIEEIEAFEGRLRVLRSLSDMATVSLVIRQEIEDEEDEEKRKEIDWSSLSLDDMGYFIRTGFISIVNVIAAIFQWIIIAVAVTSPLWLPIAVVITIVIVRIKRKK